MCYIITKQTSFVASCQCVVVSFLTIVLCPQYVSEVVIGAPYTVGKDLLDHFKVSRLSASSIMLFLVLSTTNKHNCALLLNHTSRGAYILHQLNQFKYYNRIFTTALSHVSQ